MDSQINEILNKNVIGDLKHALKKRKCLNTTNSVLIYIFHVVQTGGILVTTIGAGYTSKIMVWLGAGLNALATLIHVYENLNNNISKHLLQDIKAIKDGTYIDEGIIIEPDEEKSKPLMPPQQQNNGADVTV